MSTLELSPDQLEALADMIATRLAARSQHDAPGGGLLTAHQLARKLGVSVSYVRAHADEFGAIRIGNGPKPRVRFRADAAMPAPAPTATARPRPRRRSAPAARAVGSVLIVKRREAVT